MARYIDADKLSEYITTNYCKNCDIYDGEKCNSCLMNDALNFIETFQTADVVPKSEVKKIFKEFERLMENNEVWFGQTDEMREEFAELKKKYTEENKE